jgi:dihydrofolate reductase
MTTERATLLYIATSLDGYIADENGEIGWLTEYEGKGDYGYTDFINSVDTIIMGRLTYEQVLSFASWPYPGKKCYVFSRRRQEPDKNVIFVHDNPAEFMRRLKQEPGANIWLVGGAGLVAAFLKDNLVDEFIISIIPIILGNGIPLFSLGNPQMKLSLLATRNYGELAQLHYALKK